jgi:imidazolonepropionase-like amidohydrolase
MAKLDSAIHADVRHKTGHDDIEVLNWRDWNGTGIGFSFVGETAMTQTLITGGTVLSCTGASPTERTAVLVNGNRIEKLGPDAELKTYAAQKYRGVRTIDATGMTVMPGLIDVHVHVSYGDITSAEELNIYTSAEYRTLRASLAVRKVLRAGVTSIVDPGSTYGVAVAIRDGINAGLIEGPRMVAAGQYITTYNGIGSIFPTWIEHPVSAFSVMRNTRDEMITEVRKQVRDGVDLIKVSGDGDHVRNSGMMLGSLTLDDLKAIADMAHLLGKRCTIHARSGRAASDAARAGFDWVIHASYLSDDDLAVFYKTRTPINPTLALLANAVEWGPDLGISDGLLDGWKRELEIAGRCLSKAYREGIRFMAGTDSGQSAVPYGEWHAREMEHLAHFLGMSTMDALMAGTRNGAYAMGLEGEVGTVEEGRLADLLIVDGNPLADVTVLQDKSRLKMIMKDGDVVDTATALPEPKRYRWEKAQLQWTDPRVATQDFVRQHATHKPGWMQRLSEVA